MGEGLSETLGTHTLSVGNGTASWVYWVEMTAEGFDFVCVCVLAW